MVSPVENCSNVGSMNQARLSQYPIEFDGGTQLSVSPPLARFRDEATKDGHRISVASITGGMT
jgi:hypothetical protein